MHMEPSTFLVCEKGRNTEALFLPATGFLCGGHMADHIQRLVLPLGPTTPPHDGTIRLARVVDLLAREQLAQFATRAERIQAEGLALPRCHGARGRAARVRPTRLRQRVRPPRPIECAIAQHHHRRPCGAQPTAACDEGDRERCGKVALRSVAHPPRPREGSPFRHAREQQRRTPAAYAAAIPDEPHRLSGEGTQHTSRRGQQVHLRQDVGLGAPPRKACDAACRLGPVGHWRSAVRQLGALAAHEAADARRQGEQGPGDRAGHGWPG
jgi:hypothetical protein